MQYSKKQGRPVRPVSQKVTFKALGLDVEDIADRLADGIREHAPSLSKLMATCEIFKADMQTAKEKKQMIDSFFNGSRLDFNTTPTEGFFQRRGQNGYK